MNKIRLPIPQQKQAGFTLFEIMFVLIILGVLAAIAIPSWVAFMERQNIIFTRSQLVQLIRETQNKARQTKTAYGLVFDTTTDTPRIGLGRYDSSDPPTLIAIESWQTLGEGKLEPGKLLLEPVSKDNQSLVFNYNGWVAQPSETSLGNFLFKAVVSINDRPATRQCVFVRSLLGVIQEASEEGCS